MLLLTINYVPDREIEALGIVRGSVVQSKHLGKDIMAGMKSMVGGELSGYTEMLTEARNVATGRMIQEAAAMGADAIISMTYASSAITQGAAEIIAYGTAVKVK